MISTRFRTSESGNNSVVTLRARASAPLPQKKNRYIPRPRFKHNSMSPYKNQWVEMSKSKISLCRFFVIGKFMHNNYVCYDSAKRQIPNFVILLGYGAFLTMTPVITLSVLWYYHVWTTLLNSLLAGTTEINQCINRSSTPYLQNDIHIDTLPLTPSTLFVLLPTPQNS